METLPVHVFKNSFGPFLALLNEHHVKYQMHDTRAGVPMMAASGVIELLQSPELWVLLTAVIVAYLKYRPTRKVIITKKDGTVVHAEGLSPKELEKVLAQTKSLTAIETED